jgi:DNA-binding beta-propeller fold protein YncE
MPMIVGEGEYRYEVFDDWAKLPPDIGLGEVSGVAVDSKDNVFVFNRGPHPVVVLDRGGAFLRTWGQGVFVKPHALHTGPDDTIFCTDDGDHTVRQCTPEGKILLEIGVPGKPSPYMSGLPFHRCTHTAHAPDGSLYISDGYGNPCVHKYSPEGRHLRSWGVSGTGPGEFNIPHNICCDADGWVYVADRESHRVQVFDGNGRYQAQWNNLHRPCAMCLGPKGCPFCYIGELGPGMAVNRNAPNLGPRLSILSREGELLCRIERIGDDNPLNQFIAPHGIAVDSRGDIYVGEVARTVWPQKFSNEPIPDSLCCLRKFVHRPAATSRVGSSGATLAPTHASAT